MSETTEDHPAQDIPRRLAVNLDRMTVQELTALLSAAEAKRREKQESARTELLEKWRTEAEEAGMRRYSRNRRRYPIELAGKAVKTHGMRWHPNTADRMGQSGREEAASHGG